MNDTQFYFALGVPFFTIVLMYIVGAVSNRAAVNDLRSEMHAGFAALSARMDGIEKRIDRIEKKLDAIDTEIRINHDHRLAVLEARVLGRAS